MCNPLTSSAGNKEARYDVPWCCEQTNDKQHDGTVPAQERERAKKETKGFAIENKRVPTMLKADTKEKTRAEARQEAGYEPIKRRHRTSRYAKECVTHYTKERPNILQDISRSAYFYTGPGLNSIQSSSKRCFTRVDRIGDTRSRGLLLVVCFSTSKTASAG